MFDFEKLIVYKKALHFNKEMFAFFKNHSFLDPFLQHQIKRANAVLNFSQYC